MGLNLEYSAGQTPIDANESYRNFVIGTALLELRCSNFVMPNA